MNRQNAFFCYGIEKFEVYDKNPDLIAMQYGNGKVPFYIRRADIKEFVMSVLPEFNEQTWKTEYEDRNLNKEDTVDYLNYLLKGRGVVFVTSCPDYMDYKNAGQRDIQGLTYLGIDGIFGFEKGSALFPDDVSFDEIYPEFASGNVVI